MIDTTPLTLLGLRTVIHPVADLDAAKAWWTELLGFPPYFDEPFYVGFEVAGYELGLLPRPAADSDADATAVTYWGVADAAAAVARLVAAGAAVREPPREVGGGIVTAVVREPAGNLVGVIVNPHFKGGG